MKRRLAVGAAVLAVAAVAGWLVYRATRSEPGPFRVGEQLVYRVEHTSAAHSDFRAVTGDESAAARHSLHSSVQGELVLTILGRDGDTVELLAELRDAEVLLASDGPAGLVPGREAAEQLRQPVAIEASPQGHIRRLWVPEGWSGTSLGLLRSLLVAAQFVWPEGKSSTWEAEQQDDQGTAIVAYERKGDSVRRTRQRYLPAEASDDPGEESAAPVVEPEGELTAVVDGDRRLVRLEGTEATNLLLNKKLVVRSEATVKFERLRAETVSRDRLDAMKQARAELVRRRQATTLFNQASAEAVEASMARTRLNGMTLDGFLAELAKPDADETDLYLKAKALAYLQPAAAKHFAGRLLKAKPGSREAKVFVQALAASGQREAQLALVDVVRARKADQPFLMEALPSLGGVRRPGQEIDRVLQEVATGAADQDPRWTAQLALGALAKTLARRAPARSAAIVDGALRDLDRATSPADKRQALLVLGNTAAPRSLPAVRRHLAHADAAVRAGAVIALRWHPGDEVEAELCKALASDPDAAVRVEALNAFEVRPTTPKVVKALCQALSKDVSPSVRLGALGRLGAIEKPGPEVEKAIRQAASDDPDEEVRKAAAAALEG